MSAISLIDPEITFNLKALLGEGYDQLVITYIRDTQVRLIALENAIRAVDYVEIANQAHALKGSSRNVGVLDMGDTCQTLEEHARANNSGEFAPLFATIQQYFAAAKKEFSAYL